MRRSPQDYWVWSSSDARIANWAARRYLKLHSAKWLKYLSNCLVQVFSSLGILTQFTLQYLPRLLLHRSPMLRGADTELALGGFGKFTDSDAGHDINDSIAIIDCTRIVMP